MSDQLAAATCDEVYDYALGALVVTCARHATKRDSRDSLNTPRRRLIHWTGTRSMPTSRRKPRPSRPGFLHSRPTSGGDVVRVCSRPGCPNLTATGRCDDCRRDADRIRGTAGQRGYTSRGHRAFRAAVLHRDPICVVCEVAVSTVADHYPTSRRDLIAAGLNPDDPAHGRGLCARCHSTETAQHQPGGWNAHTA